MRAQRHKLLFQDLRLAQRHGMVNTTPWSPPLASRYSTVKLSSFSWENRLITRPPPLGHAHLGEGEHLSAGLVAVLPGKDVLDGSDGHRTVRAAGLKIQAARLSGEGTM